MIYRLGTRKSDLAQTQSRFIQAKLKDAGVETELIFIEGQGDHDRKTPLYEIEASTPGLFTKQLEEALLKNQIDLAVHSLKDLPTRQPDLLQVLAVPPREDVRDVIISKTDLKPNAKIGTSSLRREALIREKYPLVEIVTLRGNVPTRVGKVRDGSLDAVVLAAAGLNRLKLDLKDLKVTHEPSENFVPAPAQGALAVEARKDCPEDLKLGILKLNDPLTAQAARIERAVLAGLFGGCTLPLGVWVRQEGKLLKLNAFLGVLEKEKMPSRHWKSYQRFDISDAAEQTLIEKTVSQFWEFVDAK